MAKEYKRTDRVADYLRKELATLIQFGMRDPRVDMVSITEVEVSKDLAYARVYFTVLGKDSEDEVKDSAEALNRAAGFMRSQLSKDSSMRMVPQLKFLFDKSVGRGRYMEDLIGRPNVTLLRYEDMVVDLEGWLRKITMKFDSGADPALIDRLRAKYAPTLDVSREDKWAHRRKITPGDFREKLRPETIDRLNAVFNDTITRLDYPM